MNPDVENAMAASNLFRGARIRLTALTPDDLLTMACWYEDAEFLRLYDSRPAYPKTEAELKKWLEEVTEDKNTFVFAVRPLEADALLGYLELDGVDWQHGVCGMGLGFGEEANRGKGYGYEATRLGLKYAFAELNLHRVQVTVFSYNQRSLALVHKAGFRREGVFRERLQRDGKRHDMFLYGMLRQEWEALTPVDHPGGSACR
jgi:RimJ/RimL family protein N-acetyltransferase